jgi:hypothetical protein
MNGHSDYVLQHKNPSYANDLKVYQLSITSAAMEWPRSRKWILAVGSHDCKFNGTQQWNFIQPLVNQLNPTSTNLT